MIFYLVLLMNMVFAERLGWGEYVDGGDSCKFGLVPRQDHCCWRGQDWKDIACVGTPQCPEGFSKSGNTCKPSSCLTGQTRVPDKGWGVCCWPGQTYSPATSSSHWRCVGEPTSCPSGTTKTNDDCIKVFANPTSVVKIPAGTFWMGCTSEQGNACKPNEIPKMKVTISKDFYIMKTEVTQALYERVMGENPSFYKDENRPVDNVSWYDAVRFCNKLSEMEGLNKCYTINGNDVSWSNKSCNGWRLPTEAEWEYAARGGQSYKYAGSDNIADVAWYLGRWTSNSGDQTHPVGQRKPNGFGLYDMSGNVAEWVFDGSFDYDFSPHIDLVGSHVSQSMCRGGSLRGPETRLRVSFRSDLPRDFDDHDLGFRAVRNP